MISPRRDWAAGLRYGRALGACGVALCALVVAGCQAWAPATYIPPEFSFGPPPPQSNPALVPVMNPDLVWDQVVDVVDDYFQIEREERVRLVGDLLTEGRLDTYPRGSSTVFEPWNRDVVTRFQRWESTLQSMRRTAIVRVIPSAGGFLVDVQVLKELEDVRTPETGSVSLANSASLRNDDALQRVRNPVAGTPATLGWIDVGRDLALEQVILADIHARLGGYGVSVTPGPEPVIGIQTAAK
jgi:hypothetical protein